MGHEKRLAILLLSVSRPLSRGGVRDSKLANIYASRVQQALRDAFPAHEGEIINYTSAGDKKVVIAEIADAPLAKKKVDFVGMLDDAVANGKIDFAIHSAKDIPPESRWRDDLTIGCFMPRTNAFDELVGPYSSIYELPEGARVGTSSMRRGAFLKSKRPDVKIIHIRGNVDARLALLASGSVDALILAGQGIDDIMPHSRRGVLRHLLRNLRKLWRWLRRRGFSEQKEPFRTRIPLEDMLPGAAQGIIACVCRKDDEKTLALLRSIDNHDSRIAATAEMALLNFLDVHIERDWGGRPPIGVLMDRVKENWILRARLSTEDGSRVVETIQTEGLDCDPERAKMLGIKSGENLSIQIKKTLLTFGETATTDSAG